MLTKRVSIPVLVFLLFSVLLITDVTAVDVTTETTSTNTTKKPDDSEDKLPAWTGYLGCIIASVFFGSNLLPVKQFSAGDGVFFQFVYCVAVWAVGLIVDLILKNERFYPLVLVGGLLWTTGNMFTVFCIKTCGLSVGLLIWGTTSLVMGWAGGRFGIFGLTPQVPSTDSKLAMNYLGVVFAALSGIFFLFIKSTNQPRSSAYTAQTDEPTPLELSKIGNMTTDEQQEEVDFPFLNKMSPTVQKVVGCTLAAFAGLFYGLMFVPDQYIRDHQPDYLFHGKPPPKNGLYYVNSQYSGILLSSMTYFIVYSIFKRNKPSINPSIALPAMVSGVMWAVANIGFIVAISTLTGAVAYPIVNVLPGIVSSLWSLFLFREIQGKKNLIFLGIGMLLRILAAVLSGLSG